MSGDTHYDNLKKTREELYSPKFQQALEDISIISQQWSNMYNSEAMQNALQNALQNTFTVAKRTEEEINKLVKNNAAQQAIQIGQKIAEIVSNIQIPQIPEKTIKALAHGRYIDFLRRIKWPLFLINDEEFEQLVKDACPDETDVSKVCATVSEYFDAGYLSQIEDRWSKSTAIKQDRKPILMETLKMHRHGNYYASTSILMCQVYGVGSDIVDLSSSNGLVADDADKAFVAEHYGIAPKYIDKEKGKLLQTVLFPERRVFLWDAMAEYLKNEVLCSSDSMQKWANQPIRNKICHGEQLNFGSCEHSIKAILVIDMLIQLANEIEIVISNRA